MATELLRVNGISAGTEEKSILHSIDLSIGDGQAHVLMGPNGAGKSTLGRVIMGDPTYMITDGSLIFNGEDVTELAADKRSLAGIFLSYQAPVEVPGVPLYSFLRTITQMRPELKMTARQFRQRVGQISDQLELDQGFLMRELNVGFSGGEKKKVEMLQLLLLQPKLAILDETDSGLDIDALRIVSEGVNRYSAQGDRAVMLITHYTRILRYIEPTFVHVFVDGRIVDQGGRELADKLEAEGYEAYVKAASANA